MQLYVVMETREDWGYSESEGCSICSFYDVPIAIFSKAWDAQYFVELDPANRHIEDFTLDKEVS